jgi:hypothetical protein
MPWEFMVINRKMRDRAQYFVLRTPAEQGMVGHCGPYQHHLGMCTHDLRNILLPAREEALSHKIPEICVEKPWHGPANAAMDLESLESRLRGGGMSALFP